MGLTICALLSVAASCLADEASHRRAVEDLFIRTDMQSALDQTVMQISAALTGAAPEDAGYRDAVDAYVRKYISWDAMKEELAALYMKAFTEQEVAELVAFFNTAVGSRYLQQTPVLGQEIAAAVHRRLVENSPELKKMMMDADFKVFQDVLDEAQNAPADQP
jgi:uncharacterized protein